MNPVIILVNPQMGENIGASARVMKNFGIYDLRIVQPRDNWPNDKAIAMAAYAQDIVDDAKIYNTLSDAISDLTFIYASTARNRDIYKQAITSKKLRTDYIEKLDHHSKIGIIFGREKSGLTNDEIKLANRIVFIDTDEIYSSLNLAQAVAIICYELHFIENKINNNFSKNQLLATKADVEHFLLRLLEILRKKSFFNTTEKAERMELKISNIFNKIELLSREEIKILHGIISIVAKNQ